ncbi:MAG: hypothetical protein ABIG34_03735 [Candidatus Peregrinibacteria bacterium]
MRSFLLIAIGLQIFFGTGCWSTLAYAQEPATEMMMTVAPAHDPHAECAQGNTETPDGNEGSLPCLGHCLAEATQRAASDSSVQVLTVASLALNTDPQSPVPSTELRRTLPVQPCSLSPPPVDTVVLRQ